MSPVPSLSDSSEWLEADGLGGFASGTATGIRTRRYHALLLKATAPPAGRTVLVNGVDVWLVSMRGSFALSSQRYVPEVVHPDGVDRLIEFRLRPWPCWRFNLWDDFFVEHELFVPRGQSAVVLTWRVLGDPGSAVKLFARPFLSGRDFHATHHENGSFRFDSDVSDKGVRWQPYEGLPVIVARSNGRYHPAPEWYRNFFYSEERARGLDCVEDLATPGVLEWDLEKHSANLVMSAEGFASINEGASVGALVNDLRSNELRRREDFPSRLESAADSYLVRRGAGNALAVGQRISNRWQSVFETAWDSFRARFWNENRGQLYDIVDVDHRPGATDQSIRPNQIFAVGGLPLILLPVDRARRVVDAVEAGLYTPVGLRSLAPGESGYVPRYEGDVWHRDTAYHQGTAWPWLIGPFVEAWVRVRDNTADAKRQARQQFLEPFLNHLGEAGLGHVSEIADAEPPHTPRGCPFQAWSLGELLRLDRLVLGQV